MYKPLVFSVPIGKNDILDKTNKKLEDVLTLSGSINQPLMSLGFHHFLHRTKDSMDITNKLKTKTKFYYVVNPFEHIVSDYKENITNETKKFFNIKNEDPKILSRAFYKMWEMLVLFELTSEDKLTYAALAEGPGAFIQAVIEYRKKFTKNIKKDRLFGVTIHPEQGNFIEMGKQFMSYYKKKYPRLLKIHKTYSKDKIMKYSGRDNGDITQVKTISNFKKDILKSKKYADLVTADGGFRWHNENYQEQEAYQLILGEIIGALRVQAKGGHFVLKIFETFTNVTLKMIYLLSSFYKECHVYKPYLSRESNSEKYIICKDFLFDQSQDSKKLDQKISSLEQVLEGMSSNKFTNNIFPDLKLSEEFVNKFKFINIQIMNKQQIMINQIITYIKNNNYYGEEYHKYRKAQIEANKWWLNRFYKSEKDYSKNRKELIEELNKRISFNNSEIKNFNKLLI